MRLLSYRRNRSAQSYKRQLCTELVHEVNLHRELYCYRHVTWLNSLSAEHINELSLEFHFKRKELNLSDVRKGKRLKNSMKFACLSNDLVPLIPSDEAIFEETCMAEDYSEEVRCS